MRSIAAFFAVLLFSVPAFAVDGTELLKQVDRNLNPESYESYRKLVNIEPTAGRRSSPYLPSRRARTGCHALYRPRQRKGQEHPPVGDNMWFYIPNVGKPIRITSLQSVVGGVFNNADILQLDYAAEYNVEKVEERGGEYLLHLKAKTKTVAYDRVRIVADRRSCSLEDRVPDRGRHADQDAVFQGREGLRERHGAAGGHRDGQPAL